MSTVGFDTRQRQYRGTADQHGVCGGLYLFRVAETGIVTVRKSVAVASAVLSVVLLTHEF